MWSKIMKCCNCHKDYYQIRNLFLMCRENVLCLQRCVSHERAGWVNRCQSDLNMALLGRGCAVAGRISSNRLFLPSKCFEGSSVSGLFVLIYLYDWCAKKKSANSLVCMPGQSRWDLTAKSLLIKHVNSAYRSLNCGQIWGWRSQVWSQIIYRIL